jgi:hypothetical protein
LNFRRLPLALVIAGAGAAGACNREPPRTARLPTAAEADTETVLANYAPPRLRVLADQSSEGRGRYVVIASEHQGLPAAWRPLGVVDRPPPAGYVARAGTLVWIAGHVVTATVAPAGRGAQALTLNAYDRDGKTATASKLALPCAPEGPALLQVVGTRLRGAVGCPAQDRAVLFWADEGGRATGLVEVPGLGQVEGLLRDEEGGADYLLGGRKVVRKAPDGKQTIGTVPPPGGGAETRELLRHRDELLVVEGAVGRVIRLGREGLSWRGEGRLPVGPKVERLRAVLAGDRLIVVTAERAGPRQMDLFGVMLPLQGQGPAGSSSFGQRLILGAALDPSDHELAPAGQGALLVRTHQGNTGAVVGLVRLFQGRQGGRGGQGLP